MTGHTDNAVIIDAPLDLVWETMMDVERWPDLFTDYAAAEVLERDGNRTRYRLTTHRHEGRQWSWVSERTEDPATYSSRSQRIETGPFRYMHIAWSFAAVDGGTEMRWRQEFAVKPEAPVDDLGAQEYLNHNTRLQMRVIKQRLEALADDDERRPDALVGAV